MQAERFPFNVASWISESWDLPLAATSGDEMVSSFEAVDAKLPMQCVVHTILSLPRSAPGAWHKG